MAYHFHVRYRHVPVLGIALFHVRIGSRFLRVLLHVMCHGVVDNSGGRYRMADVIRQRNGVAAYFPCASVIRGQQEFIGIIAPGEAASYRSRIGL